MTMLSKLRVQSVRTHQQKEVVFSSPTTIITGLNGSGKTSLIEAIYIALQGSSFKGSDTDVLRRGDSWYRIDVTLEDEERTVKFDPSRPSGKKQFSIGGITHYRLPHAKRYPIVLFEPDDLRLLSGSPQRRRDYLDQMIRQIDPIYDQTLRQYERSLKQRNTLLKQPHTQPDDLFVWDVSLSQYGAYIITKRNEYIEELNIHITHTYQQISHSQDIVTLKYTHLLTTSLEQDILNNLHHQHQRDILLGYTSVGPHRDDMIVSFNSDLAAKVTSRGETRTILLALKFIEAELLHERTKKLPLLLLDDVFSELDESRQKHLSTISVSQVIVTSTSQPKNMTKSAQIIQLKNS